MYWLIDCCLESYSNMVPITFVLDYQFHIPSYLKLLFMVMLIIFYNNISLLFYSLQLIYNHSYYCIIFYAIYLFLLINLEFIILFGDVILYILISLLFEYVLIC